MSELFKELRFMALRSIDKTKVSRVISESTLRKEYNFTHFCKLDDNQYAVTDLYHEGRIGECANYRSQKPRSYDLITLIPQCNIQYTELEHSSIHLHKANSFTRKPKGELLSAMKSWVSEKEDFFEKLHDTYLALQKEHKNIYLLPISLKIYLEYHGIDNLVESINHQSAILTNAFKSLITKISSRRDYETFIHYSRVILLDNRQRPFLHVVLYYKDPDISDFYIRDLTRIWCETADKAIQENGSGIVAQNSDDEDDVSVEVNYVYFDTPLPSMLNDEEEGEWEDGRHYDVNDRRYSLEVSATPLYSALNYSYHKDIIVPLSKRKRGADSSLSRRIDLQVARFSEADSYLSEAEFKKWIKGVKQEQSYHIYYLERVAKQYVKIPNLNNLSQGIFTYKK